MIGALIIYSVLAIPFRMGFRVKDTPALAVSDAVIDSLFGVDIALTFRTAVFVEELGGYETNPATIGRDYLRGFFFVVRARRARRAQPARTRAYYTRLCCPYRGGGSLGPRSRSRQTLVLLVLSLSVFVPSMCSSVTWVPVCVTMCAPLLRACVCERPGLHIHGAARRASQAYHGLGVARQI